MKKIVVVDERDVICLSKNIYLVRESVRSNWLSCYHKQGATKNFQTLSVVYDAKKLQHPIRNKCQFSWYCDGKSDEIHDWKTYNQITNVFRKVMLGEYEDNIVGQLFIMLTMLVQIGLNTRVCSSS